MTIDETINYAIELAEQQEAKAIKIGNQLVGSAIAEYQNECWECAEHNRKLAEWLTELKDLRSKQKPNWTSIDDKLPDKDGTYLCYLQCGAICQATYDSTVAAKGKFPFGDWVAVYNSETRDFTDSYWEEYDAVTHWMPCPEPPKESTNEN